MDYSVLYSVVLFVQCRSIKKISLKAVTAKGNRVELAVQYFSIPKIFFTNHSKRKFSESLSNTSFHDYASQHKKPKSVSVQRGNIY
jgi:hypothetical protein